MFMAHKGLNDTHIHFHSFDGANWKSGGYVGVLGAETTLPVALATFNDRMYLAYKGVNDNSIYFTSYNLIGNSWDQPKKINDRDWTSQPVALAEFDGKLYMAHKGGGTDNGIYYNSFDGKNWGLDRGVPGSITTEPVALAVFNKNLYLAYKDASNSNIHYKPFDGVSWGTQQTVPSASTTE
ncbi:hypothetical protein WJ90_09595 [Burkholderia ubonensis]|nr:hypothetical protein WJ90_09595 [Burkholderia ubonensis]